MHNEKWKLAQTDSCRGYCSCQRLSRIRDGSSLWAFATSRPWNWFLLPSGYIIVEQLPIDAPMTSAEHSLQPHKHNSIELKLSLILFWYYPKGLTSAIRQIAWSWISNLIGCASSVNKFLTYLHELWPKPPNFVTNFDIIYEFVGQLFCLSKLLNSKLNRVWRHVFRWYARRSTETPSDSSEEKSRRRGQYSE